MTYQFVVATGRTSVKQFLFAALPSFSRFALRQAAADGACRVDGEVVPASYKLRAGQAVEFTLEPEAQRTILAEELPLEILYEDDAFIGLNKAPGMLVHPTSRERNKPERSTWVRSHPSRIRIRRRSHTRHIQMCRAPHRRSRRRTRRPSRGRRSSYRATG